MAFGRDLLRCPDFTDENGQEVPPHKSVHVKGGLRIKEVGNRLELRGDAPGQAVKAPVRAASTGNVTIATPGASIDGVALAAGDRVLLKNQTTDSENGIYVWNGAAAAMTRAPDFAASADIATGMLVAVTAGTVNGSSLWMLTTVGALTLGSTALTFAGFRQDQLSIQGGTSYTLSFEFTTTDATPAVLDLLANNGGGFFGHYEVSTWLSGVSTVGTSCRFKRTALFYESDDGTLTELNSDTTVGTDHDNITVGGIALSEDGNVPAVVQATITGKAATTIHWSLKVIIDQHVVAA